MQSRCFLEGVRQGPGRQILPKQLPPHECPFHRGSVQAPLETVTGAGSGCSRDAVVVRTHDALPEQVYPGGQQDDTGDFASHVW